jgi:hypothetical protein
MGVRLVLDKPRARLRRRGQHARTPAARALADAIGLVLAEPPLGAPVASGGTRTVAVNFTVSPDCLLGACRGGACGSPLCEHACHSRPA